MKSFFISILAVFIMIFPSSGTLQSLYQQLTYPGETVITEKIIDAVKLKDIDALNDMFSQYSKDSIENLPQKIEDFIGCISGDITDARWYSGSTERDTSDYGSHESFRSWVIQFTTDEETYLVFVNWIRVDTGNPKKVGMSSMSMSDMQYKPIAEIY